MGTRGLYIFVYKGKRYRFYNTMDSYPEALGELLVMMIKCEDWTKWGPEIERQILHKQFEIRVFQSSKYRDFELVDVDVKEELEGYSDVSTDGGSDDELSDSEIRTEDGYSKFVNSDKWFYSYCKFYEGGESRNTQILKWDFTKLVKSQLLRLLINRACPTLIRSCYEPDITESSVRYAYIINLDSEQFEMRDFKFPFDNIPQDWIDQVRGKSRLNEQTS